MHLFSEASQFLTTKRCIWANVCFRSSEENYSGREKKKNDLFQFHKNPGQDNVQAVNLSLEMKRLI